MKYYVTIYIDPLIECFMSYEEKCLKFIIMQNLVSSGVFSDKVAPLICTPKPNSYKINAPNPANAKNIDKEALKNFEYNQPIANYHWSIENAA